MTKATMTEVYNAARTAAACAYAAQKFSLSLAFTNALSAAQDAIEAEAREYECALALYSSFPSQEEEEAALEAEREAASRAAWARRAAWNALEDAQAAYAAEEAEEVMAYTARWASHAATLAEAEEEEEAICAAREAARALR